MNKNNIHGSFLAGSSKLYFTTVQYSYILVFLTEIIHFKLILQSIYGLVL